MPGEYGMESTMKEVYQYTDLEWRLRQIPDGAACRGVYLNMLDERAAEFGPDVQHRYRDFFRTHRFSPFRLYSVKDYLTRMVVLSQFRFGSLQIYQGIYQLQAASWPAWRRTLMGRATLGVLGTDFHAILHMVKNTVRMSVNYAEFSVEGGPRRYITRHKNEYVYIEHAMAGGLAGIAEVCGVRIHMEPKLIDPFNGSIEIEVSDTIRMVAG